MIIYNVTTNIDQGIHDKWLLWMRDTHIPAMLNTKKFTKAKMCKVLIEEDMGGTTYSVQYTAPNKETLEQYYTEDADKLRDEALQLFPNQFVAFRTELEIISEQ